MKISDQIRYAAGNHLWDGVSARPPKRCAYSCNALANIPNLEYTLKPLLEEMGLPRSLDSIGFAANFREFQFQAEAQQARYAWLMFVADIYEEWYENL